MPAAQKRTPEEEQALEEQFIGASPADGDEVEQEAETVTFRSKGVNFRAVMIPRHRWTAPNGEAQVTDGKTLEFAPLGEYTTSDAAEIRHLRRLPTFNREFWEVGREPNAAPSARPMFDAIADASVAMDDGELARLEVRERETHNRGVVIEAIQSARRRVQGVLEEKRERQEAAD